MFSGSVAGSIYREIETEHCYFIFSLEADDKMLLETLRHHRQSENRLYWGVGVAFEEDRSQVRTKNAAENLALVKQFAALAVKQDEEVDAGTQTKRMQAVRQQLSTASTPGFLRSDRPHSGSTIDSAIFASSCASTSALCMCASTSTSAHLSSISFNRSLPRVWEN